MGRKKMARTKVWRETAEALCEEKGVRKSEISEACGYTDTWFLKKFNAHGFAEFSKLETNEICRILDCTEQELTALPVSPEGRNEKASTAVSNDGTEDILTALQTFNAEMTVGLKVLMKDRPTGTKIDELYDMVRNGFKMLHTDIAGLASAMEKYWGEKND